MNTQRMPGFGAVLRAQLELLVRTKYALGLFAYEMLIVFGTYFWMPLFEALPPWEGPWFIIMYGGLVGSGAIAGLIVWFGEGPRKRRYHWAMPVKREVHDLARVIAGAVWLLGIIVVCCALGWLFEDRTTRDLWLRNAPLFWASLFVLPVLSYLLFVIPYLMLDRPLLAILSVLIATTLLSLTPVVRKYPMLGDLGNALLSYKHPPSLGTALGGGLLTAPWANPENRKRVYREVSESYWQEEHVSADARRKAEMSARSNASVFPRISKREFLSSLFIWYTIALLGIAFALRRRPDV